MSEERKKVLEMLAVGKISAEEAGRLIDKLQDRRDGVAGDGEGRHGWGRRHRLRFHAAAAAGEATGEGGDDKERPLPRYLRVVVAGKNGETVNVRVPLKLIRTGIKLGAMLPTDARDKIEARGIDLSSFGDMEADELIEALNDLSVDVEDGKETVRIFCE